jgi:hypothetical protein
MLVFANNTLYEEDVAVRAMSIILSGVEQGVISEARINEANSKILHLQTGSA